jgi:hypothetical protein
MSVINTQPLIGASGNQGVAGYSLTRSLRFRSSASAYLNRTPATATNRKTWTFSTWLKRGQLTSDQTVFQAGDTYIRFGNGSADTLWLNLRGAATNYFFTTSQVFRDVSSWYHLVLSVDTTQATNTNRVKLYVNGNQVTGFATSDYPPQNTDTAINSAVAHNIGYFGGFGAALDGYLTEVNFIDGQALTPSSFGETSTTTGVWIPKKYAGTYGTNGFYLPFTNTASTSTLGNDFSGNGNTWTVNNVSLTSGATYDSMTDVPTLTSATAANYAVLNPLRPNGSAAIVNGNLGVTPSGTYCNGLSTIQLDSGAYYAECTVTTAQAMGWGIWLNSASTAANVGTTPTGFYGIYSGGATLMINGTTPYTNAGASPSNGDIVQVAWSNGKVWFGKNNTWYDSTFGTTGNPSTGANATVSSLSNDAFAIAFCGANASPVLAANFGQRPFAYTPPTGFVALNTFNLPTPTIGATASTQANKYMDATTYTANGTTQTITNSGSMQPDLVWTKRRDSTSNHLLIDSVRGVGLNLSTNSTSAEVTDSTYLTSFNSNGFSIGSGNYSNGNTMVAWQWDAGTSTVTNTSGSISSQVRANASAGFSVVTYTGTGSNATVGHGLGVAPRMIIVKCRNTAGESWQVYHANLTSAAFRMRLNSTDAQDSQPTMWNSTAPTSTVFSVGTASGTNANTQTYVAYCFAQVAGYSALGSYTGNGSTDGVFVHTGFRPKYIMIKRTDTTTYQWSIWDTSRNTFNAANSNLWADSSEAETTATAYDTDFLSNGFKLRTSNVARNASGGTYIYMAFAESPFKFANAR